VIGRLKDTVEYPDAVNEFNQQISHFQALAKSRVPIKRKISTAGLDFLRYYRAYIGTHEFWSTWSVAGAITAAALLAVPREKIAQTTNHLESHNNQVKGKMFSHHRHSGRLPRIDHWVYQLIDDVIPRFMERLVDAGRRLDYRENMRQAPTTRDWHLTERPSTDGPGVDLVGSLLARFVEETEDDAECDLDELGPDPLSGTGNDSLSLSPLEPVVLSPDGETIIVTSSPSALDELDLINLFLDDSGHALDSEDITPHLPENTPLPPPPSGQPPAEFHYDSDTPEEPFFHSDLSIISPPPSLVGQSFDQSDELVPDSDPPESSPDISPISGSHTSASSEDAHRVNSIVTTFQQLLINEDERERLIYRLLDDGVLPSQLQQHLTPYIRNRLRSRAESSSPQSPGSRISLSSPIRLSSHSPDLLPFDKQRKEKRHESRGCR